MTMRQERVSNPVDSIFDSTSTVERGALNEESFKRVIAIERKRTERSKAPFVLMLLEVTNHQNLEKTKQALDCIVAALVASCRDTDLVGWYTENSVIGVMFTGLVITDRNSILGAIFE